MDKSIWPKIPIADSEEQPKPNKLQTSYREETDGRCIDVSVSLWFPAEQHPSRKHLSMPDEANFKIAWKIAQPTDSNNDAWRSIAYFSMLPYGWIPSDGMEFFGQFILHLRQKWLKLYHEAEKSLSKRVSHDSWFWINGLASSLC
jgi:hypothetical protein